MVIMLTILTYLTFDKDANNCEKLSVSRYFRLRPPVAYLEIGKGVCHNASQGRRHSRGASIIDIGAACDTFIHGRRSHFGHYGQCPYKFMDVFLYPTC